MPPRGHDILAVPSVPSHKGSAGAIQPVNRCSAWRSLLLQLHVSRRLGERCPAELPVAAGGEGFGGRRAKVGADFDATEVLQPQLDPLVGELGQFALLQPPGKMRVPLPLASYAEDAVYWSTVSVEGSLD